MKTSSPSQKPARLAENVGSYIDKSFYKGLSAAFHKQYPAMQATFAIRKELLMQVLSEAEPICGIRFMYGLMDPLNPKSVRLFLIPCIQLDPTDSIPKNLIRERGCIDHLGISHTLPELCRYISQFVSYRMQGDSRLAHKTTTRGGFFGKNSLMALLRYEKCAFLGYHFGLGGEVIKPILEPLNAAKKAFSGVYMDFTSPCPPACGGERTCLVEHSANLRKAERKLEQIRWFRDHQLLQMPEGGLYYEMYYFISPLLMSALNQHKNGSMWLDQYDEDIIIPIEALLTKHAYAEAFDLLKTGLRALLDRFEETRYALIS